MINVTNIEPLHHEQGAYRNWYRHTRNQWFNSWKFWTRDKQLASGGYDKWLRKGKQK